MQRPLSAGQAEFQNSRKRAEKERSVEFAEYASTEAVRALSVPILDDFERATKAESSDRGIQRKGMQMIYQRFYDS